MDEKPPLTDSLLKPFLDLLQVHREACGGDLEMNIIMLSVALRTVAHPQFAQMKEEQRVGGDTGTFPTLGVNARSIAEASGMPRETVRRKIADLVEIGWLAREGRNLHLTQEAYRTLEPARMALQTMAFQCHAIVSRWLEPPGREG